MKKHLLCVLALSLGLAVQQQAVASDKGVYKVTLTNLSKGLLLTPPLAVSHARGVKVFTEGEAASEALAQLAEGGNTQPVQDALFATGKAKDAANAGPVLPGQSVSMMLETDRKASRVSLVSMILPTNDGFIALNGVRGARKGHSKVYYLVGYDAGSEVNDEHCANIPGPHCGGRGYSPEDGEGFVHIHSGIHGTGDLVAADYDWRNPVAKVVIERVK